MTLSDEIGTIVHAFDDAGRKDSVRRLAIRAADYERENARLNGECDAAADAVARYLKRAEDAEQLVCDQRELLLAMKRERDTYRADFEKAIDAHAEGGWMARALDAERVVLLTRKERDESQAYGNAADRRGEQWAADCDVLRARLIRVAKAVQQQLAEEAENYIEDADLEGMAPRDEVCAIGLQLMSVDVETIAKETP